MKRINHLLGIAAVLALVACKKETLAPLTRKAPVALEYIDVIADFCTIDRTIAKQKVKYLFILDHSRSNQPGIVDPNTPNDQINTDPDGARRYGPMVQFLNNLVPDPNNLTYFSLIDFDTKAYAPQNIKGFVQDPATFLNTYMRPDWIGTGSSVYPAPIDGGFTNYQAALKLALTVIKDDAELESLTASVPPVSIQYHLIFVTDGAPTVPNGSGVTLQTYTTDIGPVVSDLMNVKNDPIYQKVVAGVSLNTAYYFNNNPDTGAQTLLQQMASAGNGQYLEFASSQGVMYQAFAPPARSIRMNLADIWIENQNVVAWEDGRLLPDMDADGLPDEIESKLGSDMQAADSDGNGVSDLVEYRTKGVACKDSACSTAGRDPYAMCDGFGPTTSNGRVTFRSTSNDGLNDCEKFVLGADRANFDSNSDFIPDKLAFVNGIPFMAGTSGAYLNPFGDALNHYSKLKIGLPVTISQKNLLNFVPRKNSLLHEAPVSIDTECYRYTSNKVAVMRPGDVIRVYLIQNHSIINNKPVLTTTSKSWRSGDKTLTFERGDFN